MAFIASTRHEKYPFIDPAEALKESAAGKTVLVTGASSGIGKSIATAFALAGAKAIVLVARSQPNISATRLSLQAIAPKCAFYTFTADISSRESVDRLFNFLSLKDGSGIPEIMVNNAGSAGEIQDIVDTDIEKWWFDSEVNIKGTFMMCRAYLIALAGKPGTIINLSSGACNGVPPGFSGYAIGKMAINRLSEYVDAEHGGQGVRVFAVHPGAVATPQMGSGAPDWLLPHLIDSPELGAGTCVYLSTLRAAFLTGRYVSSNWDMEELEKSKVDILSKDLLKSRVAMY